MVSFDMAWSDRKIIKAIVQRANLEGLWEGSRMDLEMDIEAVHANGTPLRLAELLKADKFNFAHDVAGIQRHIDRRTGKLRNDFVPRYFRSKS